jgi:hypothetical protein
MVYVKNTIKQVIKKSKPPTIFRITTKLLNK